MICTAGESSLRLGKKASVCSSVGDGRVVFEYQAASVDTDLARVLDDRQPPSEFTAADVVLVW